MKLARTAILLGTFSLAVSGCKVKSDNEEEPPAEEPTPVETLSAETTPTPEETVASIIRSDVTSQPVVEQPPQPLAATVNFPEGGYELDPDAERVLEGVVDSRQSSEGWPIVLRGHTDSEGNDRANLIASRKRAETVAAWLVDSGIALERIDIIALGEQRPVAPNARLDGTPFEAGRARNRRVDVWVGPPGSEPPENGEEPEEEADQDSEEEDAESNS